jgi:hypothetical protein
MQRPHFVPVLLSSVKFHPHYDLETGSIPAASPAAPVHDVPDLRGISEVLPECHRVHTLPAVPVPVPCVACAV